MMDITTILIIIGIVVLFLLEGFLEVALLSLAGAFTRRIFGPKQKSFKEYYKENTLINTIVGLVTVIVFFVIIFGFIKVLV
jgi:hypothetical protein